MEQSFSVLIPDGESEFALFAAHCLARYPKVKIHVLSERRWAAIRFSRYCRTFTCRAIDGGEVAWLEAVADLVKKHKIDVLLPTETNGIGLAVKHHDVLSKLVAIAPIPDVRGFGIANNKWRLAQFMSEHDIPGPPTTLVTLDETFERQIQAMKFPVLLKPCTAWGGDGIERFEDIAGLKAYLAGREPEHTRERFVVQTALTGFVVGVNVLAQNGRILATTMQRGIIPNTKKFAAAGAIRFIKDERFLSAAEKLIRALDWSGFANLDTFYDSADDQLKILEINARFWGSLRGSLVAGVSFPYLACLAALNVPFPPPDYELARYVHTKTAMREAMLRIVGKNREKEFAVKESGLKFLLSDPLAELVRAFQQESSSREPVTI